MLKQDAINELNKDIARKFIYSPPTLVCYGRVGDLTQSGGTSSAESSIGCNGNNKVQPSVCVSDPRAKENIVRVGTHPFGIGLYLFDYKPGFQAQWGYGRQFGAMADEVETVMPEAVCVRPDGYKMVNYARLGIQRSVH